MNNISVFEEKIDEKKITDGASVSCDWDDAGIFVDFDYLDDPFSGPDGYENIYAYLYEDDDPDAAWKEALEIANYLGERFSVPVEVYKAF